MGSRISSLARISGTASILAGIFGLASISNAADPASGFIRGDASRDGRVDIADPISVFSFLFLGGTCGCLDAADFDANASIEITDGIALLAYIFQGGAGPMEPFPACGTSPEGGKSLGCAKPSCAALETVWLYQRIYGCRQCQPCFFTSIEDVVMDLSEQGIEVLEWKMGGSGLNTCMACGCPDDKAYWILVSEEDAAELSGWKRES
jgi:hypothetical protein